MDKSTHDVIQTICSVLMLFQPRDRLLPFLLLALFFFPVPHKPTQSGGQHKADALPLPQCQRKIPGVDSGPSVHAEHHRHANSGCTTHKLTDFGFTYLN